MSGENPQLDPIAESRRQWIAHGWAAAADGMATVTTVMYLNQLFLGRIDRILRPYGLTFARFEVLRLLAFTRAGALPMGKLGALLQVHPASVTNAVGRLEADRLVSRRDHPDDSRSTLAALTAKGRDLVERATADLNVFFASIEPPLGLDQLRAASAGG